MLHSLFIKNYILIDNLNLEFSDKLNVITGETGAGKSILLDAINFCLTGKGGQEVIKVGSENCMVSLSFTTSSTIKNFLAEFAIDCHDDEDITITRQINNAGKKKCAINNQMAAQKVLDALAENLVILYGQHSFSSLFKTSSHIKLLDNFITDSAAFEELAKNYKLMKNLQHEITNLKNLQENAAKETDYLEHVAGEIRAAKITEGEEVELAGLRAKMQQSAKQRQLILDLIENLQSSNITSNISSMVRQIHRSNSLELFENVAESLEKALEHFGEAEQLLENMIKSDEQNLSLEEIEERLFMIRALARKHNISADNLNSYLNEIEHKLSAFKNGDEDLRKLEKELNSVKKQYFEIAGKVRSLREEAAKKVEKLVASELEQLKMPGCNFKIEIEPLNEENATEKGLDAVSFTASTNPGSPYGLVAKIASGGEMARFMLALQVALFQNNNNLPTIIFDEIDTGIGGVVADSVGSRLRKLAENTQVLAITHQPQVASKSNHHIKVSKQQISSTTHSTAFVLSEEERIEEIARMLSGKVTTEISKKAARELIEAGHE